jgi:tetratricopeptide (TPR) repeat protein
MKKKLLGERHPSVAISMNSLAFLHYANDAHDEAMALARETLSMNREAFGDKHPEIAKGLYTLGLWTMDSGDYDAAETMLRASLAMYDELLGREHRSVAGSMALLAYCLIASGEYEEALPEEALPLATEARDIYVATLSEDHWRTAVAIGAEGAALAGLGNYEQAEPLLLRSYSVLSQDPSAQARYVDDARRRLASLYSEWGKPEQAAEYRKVMSE